MKTRTFMRRGRLLLALAFLGLAPVASHGGPVTGLVTFVNGELADADEVNANFAAVKAAIDDNDARITALESLTDTTCSSGFITGIDAAAMLECSP